MKKRILSLILAIVMVAGMLPANVLAVQSGFTAAPSESGSLIAANDAKPIGTTGGHPDRHRRLRPAPVRHRGRAEQVRAPERRRPC